MLNPEQRRAKSDSLKTCGKRRVDRIAGIERRFDDGVRVRRRVEARDVVGGISPDR